MVLGHLALSFDIATPFVWIIHLCMYSYLTCPSPQVVLLLLGSRIAMFPSVLHAVTPTATLHEIGTNYNDYFNAVANFNS